MKYAEYANVHEIYVHEICRICKCTYLQTLRANVHIHFKEVPTLCIFHAHSDISSIDHLIMREFVSGPPGYHLALKGVFEQFVVVEQNSGP